MSSLLFCLDADEYQPQPQPSRCLALKFTYMYVKWLALDARNRDLETPNIMELAVEHKIVDHL